MTDKAKLIAAFDQVMAFVRAERDADRAVAAMLRDKTDNPSIIGSVQAAVRKWMKAKRELEAVLS